MGLTGDGDRGGGRLETAVEGDERRGDVEGDEGREVGRGRSGSRLRLGDVDSALSLDLLKNGGESGGRGNGEGGGSAVGGLGRSRELESGVAAPETALEAEEVGQHNLALLREDALRVVLDRLERVLAMPQSHHDSSLRPARNLELLRKRVEPRRERMVPRRLDSLRDALEESLRVVQDRARLAVHDLSRRVDDSPVRRVHALQTHADAEDRHLACVRLDCWDGDATVAKRVSRTGGDDEMGKVGVLSLEFRDGDGLGSDHGHVGAEEAEVLVLQGGRVGQLKDRWGWSLASASCSQGSR